MSLTALAIQAEAWLQEELGAQQAVRAQLEGLEAAARKGSGDELEARGRELGTLLGRAGARDLRRQAMLQKLGNAMGLPAGEVTLTRVAARLSAGGGDTQRLDTLRHELRATVEAVLGLSRRLASLANYHRGVLEELCQVLAAGAPGDGGRLLDARG